MKINKGDVLQVKDSRKGNFVAESLETKDFNKKDEWLEVVVLDGVLNYTSQMNQELQKEGKLGVVGSKLSIRYGLCEIKIMQNNNGNGVKNCCTELLIDGIPIEKWGKDHWSLLAYIETRCVDYKGKLDKRHLRLDGKKHPTILNDGKAKNHSDLDCLKDLQAYDLIIIENLLIGQVKLTKQGIVATQLLREHKIKGGVYADFPKSDREKFIKI